MKVLVLWSAILKSDNEGAASEASAWLADPRVEHFWDGEAFVAQSYGRFFGYQTGKPAWDIYLLYPPGVVWGDSPPPPRAYLQRGEPQSDFKYAPELLEQELRKLLQ